MAIVLALISALAYGISDYLGGIFAKAASPWQIAVVGQSSSAMCAVTAATIIGWDSSTSDLLNGALAGLGGGAGVAFLYRGLATAKMSVVAPISAVGAAIIPVVFGLATGERPSWVAATGIVVAFPAIALISRVSDDNPNHRGGVVDGTLAGVGFGLLFAFLGRASDDAGLGPLAMSQLTSVAAVIVLATLLRHDWLPRTPAAWRAVMMGPLGTGAQGAFLLATQQGLLSIVSVISSLYPAATVGLAAILLKEKIRYGQAFGLCLALVAVILVVTG